MKAEPKIITNRGLPREVELLSHEIIRCALEVHRSLGPGLIERVYGDALAYELRTSGIAVEREVSIMVPYKSIQIEGQRLDFLVGRTIILEIKSVVRVLDLHRAQLLSYLRATNLPLGLLLNFNVDWLREGLHRVINERLRTLNSATTDSLSSSPPSIEPSLPSRSHS